MSKLMHNVRAYIFLFFCGFISVAYTTLNKLLAVFLYIIFAVLLTCIIRYLIGRPSYDDWCVFFKWRPAAILDFGGSEILSYFCFRDVGFSLWAKFYVSSCNTDRLMAVKVNFQNGGCRHLEFFSELKCQVSASRGLPVSTSTLNLVKISQRAAELWRFMCFQNGGRPPSWIFAEL